MAKTKNRSVHLLWIFICASFCFAFISEERKEVIDLAKSQLHVREKTGNNDGKEVETYLSHVGLKKGDPWCAAFVSYVLSYSGIENTCIGYSPVWFRSQYLVYKRDLPGKTDFEKVQPADVFGIYFLNKNRIAHVGFIIRLENQYILTIEGNTNEVGSREGDGVYSKRRNTDQIYAVSNYIR